MTAKAMRRESVVQCAIVSALRWRTDVLMRRQNTGAARLPVGGGKTRPIRFGNPGQGDLVGLQRGSGRYVEIEVKSETGRLTPQQIAHGQMIRDAGGVYVVARSVDECMRLLDEAFGRVSK